MNKTHEIERLLKVEGTLRTELYAAEIRKKELAEQLKKSKEGHREYRWPLQCGDAVVYLPKGITSSDLDLMHQFIDLHKRAVDATERNRKEKE